MKMAVSWKYNVNVSNEIMYVAISQLYINILYQKSMKANQNVNGFSAICNAM
jgi:hypothetical protein